jgi:hypothetical protein
MNLCEQVRALRPQGRLSSYCHFAQTPALFPQFAAVVARLKPGMDCWVASEKYESFHAFARGIGLSLAVDCAFRELPSPAKARVIGLETLCTTYAHGVCAETALPGDMLHVFVGRTPEAVDRLRASGWYPVVINGRVHNKPFVDHLEFGRALGYPECCVQFFMKSNNWNRTNSYAEALANSHAGCDYLTNCFGKNYGYSFNFHIPCRFDCPETIRQSAMLEQFLDECEPDYTAACRKLLGLPVLSLNEREVVLLDGDSCCPGSAKYTSVQDLFMTPPEVMRALEKGNSVEIRGRFLAVLSDAEPIEIFECRCDQFGPRVPLLLTWRGHGH